MSAYESLRDEYLLHMAHCATCNAIARPHQREGRHDYIATAELCPNARRLLDRIEQLF